MYCSPELYRREGTTAAADVWSFGLLLYYCLYGRPLFDGVGPSGCTKSKKEVVKQQMLAFAGLPPAPNMLPTSPNRRQKTPAAADTQTFRDMYWALISKLLHPTPDTRCTMPAFVHEVAAMLCPVLVFDLHTSTVLELYVPTTTTTATTTTTTATSATAAPSHAAASASTVTLDAVRRALASTYGYAVDEQQLLHEDRDALMKGMVPVQARGAFTHQTCMADRPTTPTTTATATATSTATAPASTCATAAGTQPLLLVVNANERFSFDFPAASHATDKNLGFEMISQSNLGDGDEAQAGLDFIYISWIAHQAARAATMYKAQLDRRLCSTKASARTLTRVCADMNAARNAVSMARQQQQEPRRRHNSASNAGKGPVSPTTPTPAVENPLPTPMPTLPVPPRHSSLGGSAVFCAVGPGEPADAGNTREAGQLVANTEEWLLKALHKCDSEAEQLVANTEAWLLKALHKCDAATSSAGSVSGVVKQIEAKATELLVIRDDTLNADNAFEVIRRTTSEHNARQAQALLSGCLADVASLAIHVGPELQNGAKLGSLLAQQIEQCQQHHTAWTKQHRCLLEDMFLQVAGMEVLQGEHNALIDKNDKLHETSSELMELTTSLKQKHTDMADKNTDMAQKNTSLKSMAEGLAAELAHNADVLAATRVELADYKDAHERCRVASEELLVSRAANATQQKEYTKLQLAADMQHTSKEAKCVQLQGEVALLRQLQGKEASALEQCGNAMHGVREELAASRKCVEAEQAAKAGLLQQAHEAAAAQQKEYAQLLAEKESMAEALEQASDTAKLAKLNDHAAEESLRLELQSVRSELRRAQTALAAASAKRSQSQTAQGTAHHSQESLQQMSKEEFQQVYTGVFGKPSGALTDTNRRLYTSKLLQEMPKASTGLATEKQALRASQQALAHERQALAHEKRNFAELVTTHHEKLQQFEQLQKFSDAKQSKRLSKVKGQNHEQEEQIRELAGQNVGKEATIGQQEATIGQQEATIGQQEAAARTSSIYRATEAVACFWPLFKRGSL